MEQAGCALLTEEAGDASTWDALLLQRREVFAKPTEEAFGVGSQAVPSLLKKVACA